MIDAYIYVMCSNITISLLLIAETSVCSCKYYVLSTTVLSLLDDSDLTDYWLDDWIDLTEFWDD